jgi:hypothetical protein
MRPIRQNRVWRVGATLLRKKLQGGVHSLDKGLFMGATSKLQFLSVNLQDPVNWTHFSFTQFAADQNSLMGLMASSLHTDKKLDKISIFVQLVFYFF